MMHIRFHSEDSETSEKVYIDYHFTDKEIKKTIQKSFGKSRHHNSILYAVCLSGKFIREYMGFEFSQIRKMCEVTSSQLQRQVLCRSMALYMNNSNISRIEGGSSHAFIFTTYDDMFVIKTITSAERKLFIKMLPKYLSRIMCHENSRLVRILGIFKLLPDNQDFLIMENIVPDKKKAMIFDLKGSLVDRKVEGTEDFPKGVVLKDQNFIDCKMKIRLGEEQMKEILSTLEEDFELLESENIMDYSILLAVYDRNLRNDNRYCFNSLGKSYSLGIIDILQEYNFVKISEKNIKSIYKKNRVMMSVAEPNKYFNRITGFLLNIFEVIDEE